MAAKEISNPLLYANKGKLGFNAVHWIHKDLDLRRYFKHKTSLRVFFSKMMFGTKKNISSHKKMCVFHVRIVVILHT